MFCIPYILYTTWRYWHCAQLAKNFKKIFFYYYYFYGDEWFFFLSFKLEYNRKALLYVTLTRQGNSTVRYKWSCTFSLARTHLCPHCKLLAVSAVLFVARKSDGTKRIPTGVHDRARIRVHNMHIKSVQQLSYFYIYSYSYFCSWYTRASLYKSSYGGMFAFFFYLYIFQWKKKYATNTWNSMDASAIFVRKLQIYQRQNIKKKKKLFFVSFFFT